MRHWSGTTDKLRGWLLVIILLSVLAAGAELLLVSHHEDIWQSIPLALLGLSLGFFSLGIAASPSRGMLRAWQALMAAYVLSGFLGLGLHWKGKLEFKREANPSAGDLQLLWEAMQTQSPPTLAPGMMIQIGLLGLLYAYRHPVLMRAGQNSQHQGEDR